MSDHQMQTKFLIVRQALERYHLPTNFPAEAVDLLAKLIEKLDDYARLVDQGEQQTPKKNLSLMGQTEEISLDPDHRCVSTYKKQQLNSQKLVFSAKKKLKALSNDRQKKLKCEQGFKPPREQFSEDKKYGLLPVHSSINVTYSKNRIEQIEKENKKLKQKIATLHQQRSEDIMKYHRTDQTTQRVQSSSLKHIENTEEQACQTQPEEEMLQVEDCVREDDINNGSDSNLANSKNSTKIVKPKRKKSSSKVRMSSSEQTRLKETINQLKNIIADKDIQIKNLVAQLADNNEVIAEYCQIRAENSWVCSRCEKANALHYPDLDVIAENVSGEASERTINFLDNADLSTSNAKKAISPINIVQQLELESQIEDKIESLQKEKERLRLQVNGLLLEKTNLTERLGEVERALAIQTDEMRGYYELIENHSKFFKAITASAI